MVLLSTHIVSDIEYIANEIWLLKDGETYAYRNPRGSHKLYAGKSMGMLC